MIIESSINKSKLEESMEKEINFGIGFVTGRSNVCNIINSYYEYCLEQLHKFNQEHWK